MQSLTLPDWVLARPAVSVLLPIGLGSLMGMATRPEKLYMSLKQPPLRPPPWIFGPVWTILYGLMGYAAHRAWAAGTTRSGTGLYTLQLALNMTWTPLFFVLRRPVAATVDIVALLALNVYLTALWSGVDTVAAWCMVPYVGWLGFATYLCAGVGYLNNWDFSRAAPDHSSKRK